VDLLGMSDRAGDEANMIEVRGVSKSFGKHVVISGLDFEVPKGKNFVVMGLSGTGKSVTLKILAGLLPPDSGTVRLNGVDITNASREDMSRARAGLGFLFQSAALIKWMTAKENVALPLLEAGVPEREADERALHCLEEVGLADAADKAPDDLSGGQRKRVGFARATIHSPKVILYDEPTTGLDPITKRTIDELIVRGRDKYGATGVIVSHDLRSAVRVADVIGLLYEGRLVVVAPPDEFLKSDHEVVRKFVQDGASATDEKLEVP
jgi:phospholipid/cholesterol/gamma-HCH transport system ATP-binding protein